MNKRFQQQIDLPPELVQAVVPLSSFIGLLSEITSVGCKDMVIVVSNQLLVPQPSRFKHRNTVLRDYYDLLQNCVVNCVMTEDCRDAISLNFSGPGST